jgi:hypothetical protein
MIMSSTDAFNSDASIKAIGRGFTRDRASRSLLCVFCAERFERGLVHEVEGRRVSARRAAEAHIEKVHGGVFAALLGLGKGATGISETQEAFLSAAYSGVDDSAIAVALGGISTSAVRNHRFQFRKRVIEARILLALAKILERRQAAGGRFVVFDPAMPMRDERAAVTAAEAAAITAKFFENGGVRLKRFPPKEKQRLVVLARIADRIDRDRTFTETEINAILRESLDDYVGLRRYLVDYRFLERKPDGSAYRRI